MAGFNHAIAGGSGKLIVSALQSPDYNPATNTGWTINKDGTATFYSVSLPGVATGSKVTFASTAPLAPNVGDVWYDTAAGLLAQQWDGSDWVPYQIGGDAIASGAVGSSQIAVGTVIAGVVNGTTIEGSFFVGNGTTHEVMLYNGTPAPGNLLLSVSSDLGIDIYGNTYLDGFATYGPNNGSAQIVANATSGQPFVILSPPSVTHVNELPQISVQAANAGLSNEFLQLFLTSGTEGSNGDTTIRLYSQTFDGTGIPQMHVEVNNVIVLEVQQSVIQANAVINGVKPGTTTAEGWNNITLDSGWAAGAQAPQYRMLPDGNVQVRGSATHAGTTAAVNINNSNPIPSGYWPGQNRVYRPPTAGDTAGTVQIGNNGVFAMRASGFTATQAIMDGIYST
jgi:hypothetical protein